MRRRQWLQLVVSEEALRKENDGALRALLGCPWLRARARQRMRGRDKERALGFSTPCTRGELASMQASEGATRR